MILNTVIPDFDENGYLPPGVHPATLDVIESRFGSGSPSRADLMQSLRWLVEMCLRDDVLRLVVNGSFVTSKDEPGDVDCALLGGPTFGKHGISIHEWRTPVPFIHLEIGDAIMFQTYINEIYATDLRMVRKGVIEVILSR